MDKLLNKLILLQDEKRALYKKATKERDKNYAHGSMLTYGHAYELLKSAVGEDRTSKEKCNLADANGWLLCDFPENMPLYKDSGLWQLRSDDMEEVVLQQGVNESDNDFIERCKACR